MGREDMEGSTMIRWKAVLPIILVCGILALGYVVFFDKIVTKTLILVGQEATGARVDIASSKLTFSPFGIELNGIEVADPDRPFVNLFEANRVVAAINFGLLLEKKIVVETVDLSGLELGTSRKSSGELKRKKISKSNSQDDSKKEEKNTDSGGLRESLENVKLDDMLDKEPLAIEVKRQHIQDNIKAKEADYKARLANATYSQQFDEIKKGLSGITSLKVTSLDDIQRVESAIESYTSTQKKIETLKTTILDQKRQFDMDVSSLKRDILDLKKVGEEDYNRLLSTVDIGGVSQGNVSQTLLNSTVKSRIEKGVAIWGRVSRLFPEKKEEKPVMEGITVAFPTPHNPVPSLWIKHIRVSGVFQGTDLKGSIHNITSDQGVLNTPTTYTLNTVKNKGSLFEFALSGSSDFRTQPDEHRISFTYNHVPLPRVPLSHIGSKSIVLEKGVSNSKGDVLIEGSHLKGRIVTIADGLEFSPKATPQRARDLGDIMVNVLQGISTTKVVMTVSGSMLMPSISISSDSDDVLSKATKRAADEQIAEYKKELKQRIDNEVTKTKNQLTTSLSSSLGDFGNVLSKDVDSITSLDDASAKAKTAAQAQIDAYKRDLQKKADEEKARLKQEKEKEEAAVRKKAAEEKARLQAEIEAQKVAAKKAAEDEKKRLEEDAKKQAEKLLKNLF